MHVSGTSNFQSTTDQSNRIEKCFESFWYQV